ncbi:hypothetical protein EV359DRAFT_87704 [Lentinula novae-zelandiae]|nr:hypothetical protein EV359DRAFT_87704 [Lentinula novae-zelandiae]
MAQLLADNWQLREGQVKANNYHRHFNHKLDWLMMETARRRNLPPEMPEPGLLNLPKKRKRVVDSEEEEKEKRVEEGEEEVDEESAPKKAQSEKRKEREEHPVSSFVVSAVGVTAGYLSD